MSCGELAVGISLIGGVGHVCWLTVLIIDVFCSCRRSGQCLMLGPGVSNTRLLMERICRTSVVQLPEKELREDNSHSGTHAPSTTFTRHFVTPVRCRKEKQIPSKLEPMVGMRWFSRRLGLWRDDECVVAITTISASG